MRLKAFFQKQAWYPDYTRMTDDPDLVIRHFLRDLVFQHRLRYMIYFRTSQTTENYFLSLFCKYRLYRMSRKFGIEIKPSTHIGPGFVMTHPYNITVFPSAILGRNITLMKGSTIGLSHGKHPGAPTIGDSVYVGINSTILGGITVGDDVLVAPNTLITQDVPSHSVVIGNPCTIIHKENATAPYIWKKV